MGGVPSSLAGGWWPTSKLSQAEENQLEVELQEVEREEEALKGTVQELKDELAQASKRSRLQLEEIRKLTRRLDELKNGNGKETKRKRAGTESKRDPEEQPRMKIPEEVFPEEVWRMIIGNVSDPKDLWNLCNTCQLFDNILSKWKTGWLLGQALPYLYKDLHANKLLECRTICKSWKAGIDDFLGNHPSTRPHDPDRIDPRRLDFVNPVKEKLLTGTSYLLCAYAFIDYIRKPEPKRPAPFIGHFADMYLECGPDDGERLVDDARKYLNRFGKDVWDLVIILPGPEMIPDESIQSSFIKLITVDLFRLVPNLRRIDMRYVNDTIGLGNPPEIDLASIPDAPQLDTFLSHNIDHEDAILEALLNRFHVQLRKLCLTVHTWNRVRHLQWNNLTELQVTCDNDLEDSRSLRGVWMPRLSKLSLDLRALYHDRITFANLLEYLESIRQLCQTTTLNTIRLDGGLQALRMRQMVGNEHVTLGIKTLEIDHNWGEDDIPSYTFLLSFFPLIENLHLFVRGSDSVDSNGPETDLLPWEECERLAKENGFQEVVEIVEVNKYVYRRQMYRSNIWELLPRLEVFSFQWDVYTRHGYEEYLEKKEKR